MVICLLNAWPLQKVISQEYFQQEVNSKIHVTLDDMRHELNAFETIEYINHSPDTLGFLYFHLWPNGYSGNDTPLAKQLMEMRGKQKLFDDHELKGYIDSLDFRVNDQRVQWHLLPGQPDICMIELNRDIAHGDTIIISTPFHVKIPKGVTSRLGHIGESYQISQWYPKPAVYDRSGWHQMSYLDQGEFYSEFGSFDVSITLPANYIVGATGDLQNSQEVEMLNNLAADTAWKQNKTTGMSDFPASSKQMKTLRYTGQKIHDFAWFADKRFHVLKGKVKLPESGMEVTTWLLFTDQQSDLWKDALPYINSAIWNFSEWIGDYPYESYTAVQSALNAGAGMEYPGITVIGLADDAYALDQVITHEACHNWFYSALGSNERRFPFMDEGFASAYEARLLNIKYPDKKLWEVYIKNRKLAKFFHIENMPVQRMEELAWLIQARENTEQAIDLAATDFTFQNYSFIVYNKAAIGFNYLRAYLGDSLFDSRIHNYYRTWKFRHPQPEDLQNIFEYQNNKDLSWFFTEFIGTTKRLDYKVVRYESQKLLVKNSGELASPFVITGMDGDSICFDMWSDGFEGQRWIQIPSGKYSEIKIDYRHIMPEINRLNNNIRTTGNFRKSDPVRTQLYFTMEDTDKRTIMYIPAINWTGENGFMIGLALHNGFLLPKPLEYFILPFYSFKNSVLAGFGRISYNIIPYQRFFRKATITLEGTQFGAPGNQNYHKVKTGLDLYVRAIHLANPLRQKIYGYYVAASDLFQVELPEKAKMISFLQFGYQLEKTSLVNPFSLIASFECNKFIQKTTLELNYKYSYRGKNNGLEIRMFTGIMLKNTSKDPFYALAPGGRSGRELYLYQGLYPDRFSMFPTTLWSRQMDLSEGALVSPVNGLLGYSQRLISLSLTSSLPGKAGIIPIKPFVNILLNDHGAGAGHNYLLFYEAGLKAGIWKLFEIYLPFWTSTNISFVNTSLKDRISIVLNLNSLNQVKLKTSAQ